LRLKDNDDVNREILSSDRKEAYKNQTKRLVNRYEDELKIIDYGKSKMEGKIESESR
jgi:hypothetical protein